MRRSILYLVIGFILGAIIKCQLESPAKAGERIFCRAYFWGHHDEAGTRCTYMDEAMVGVPQPGFVKCAAIAVDCQ